jgi:hypothetical protein
MRETFDLIVSTSTSGTSPSVDPSEAVIWPEMIQSWSLTFSAAFLNRR